MNGAELITLVYNISIEEITNETPVSDECKAQTIAQRVAAHFDIDTPRKNQRSGARAPMAGG